MNLDRPFKIIIFWLIIEIFSNEYQIFINEIIDIYNKYLYNGFICTI